MHVLVIKHSKLKLWSLRNNIYIHVEYLSGSLISILPLFILCFFTCSSNPRPESTSQPTKVEVTREPPKLSTDKRSPLPNPQPTLSPTTAQETTTLRHCSVPTKPESVPSATTALPGPTSKPAPILTSVQKGKPLRIPVTPPTASSVATPHSRTGTDENTGARENSQPCTPTTGTPAQVSASPTKQKRIVPETTASKSEIVSKMPTETAVSPQQTNGRKSKTVRRLSSKSLKTASDGSPLPSSPGVKELERKASESSIISTNSDSASSSTDKSEETETPAQVSQRLFFIKVYVLTLCFRMYTYVCMYGRQCVAVLRVALFVHD